MGRTLFALTIAVNSGVLSLILAAVLATYVFADDPEAGMGWGLLWAISVPAIVLLSCGALALYPAYVAGQTASRRFMLYIAAVLGVSGLAPALTLGIVRAVQSLIAAA